MIAEVAIKHLKTLSQKRLKEFVENVASVMEDFKPSFLFDICSVKLKQLQQLVTDLNDSNNKEPLIILAVDDVDYLIGESYESFDHKRLLVKYQSQSKVIKAML